MSYWIWIHIYHRLCKLSITIYLQHPLVYMGLVVTKHVFGVTDKASFKPVSSATETSKKIEISPISRLHMILSNKRITKVLISLRGCAGWSAPVLFANPRRKVFSRRGPYVTILTLLLPVTTFSLLFQLLMFDYKVHGWKISGLFSPKIMN